MAEITAMSNSRLSSRVGFNQDVIKIAESNTLAIQPGLNDDASIIHLEREINRLLGHRNPKSQENLYRLLMCMADTLNNQCIAIGDKNNPEYEKFDELQDLVSHLAIKCDEFEIEGDV